MYDHLKALLELLFYRTHVSLVIDRSTVRGFVVYLISTQYIPQAVYL